MQGKRNLAHRMGRWSGTHPWTAILGWMAFVVVSFVIGSSVVTPKTLEESEQGVGESGRAAKVLDEAFPTSETRAGEMILVQTHERPAGRRRPERRRRRRARARRWPRQRDRPAGARALEGRPRGAHPLRHPRRLREGRSTRSRRSKRPSRPSRASTPVYASSSSATPRPARSSTTSSSRTSRRRSSSPIPITLLILLLAFGALLAAGIPVLLGLTSVFAAFGLTAVSSQFIATGESTQILMMLIGMAVGVDYSLFYLKREREERARGAGKLAALEAAAATSGHAVLVSGLTVMASLAGMFFLGEPEGGAMAIGSILVVGVAVLGSLTVLPAVLAKLGDRVHKSRLPLLRRLKREERDSRVWGFVLGHVMRRPLVSLVAGVGILVALALPALGMHTKQTGLDDISRDAFPVLKTYDHIQESFPAEKGAADGRHPVQRRDAPRPCRPASPTSSAGRSPAGKVLGPINDAEISRDGTVAHVDLPLVGDGSNSETMAALADRAGTRARDHRQRAGHDRGRRRRGRRDARTATTTSRRTHRSCSASCSRWRSCSCSSPSGRS